MTVDAGAHMLPAMALLRCERPRSVLISSGLATMGFSLLAAIAAIARPGRRVFCLTGDGGLGMALAELETIARRRLPVTVVVFNDSALTLIELKQRADDQGGTGAVRYLPVDFAGVARSSGMWAWSAHTVADLEAALSLRGIRRRSCADRRPSRPEDLCGCHAQALRGVPASLTTRSPTTLGVPVRTST